MASTLEQQLADYAALHNLDALTVVFIDGGVAVSAHRNLRCATDRLYGRSFADALADAVGRLSDAEQTQLIATVTA